MIDTHAHLYARQFDGDRPEALARARAAGVTRIYLPNIDADSVEPMLALEAAAPGYCFAMMGLHPCSVKEDYVDQLNTLAAWWDKRDFVAVGEIGTDLYWDQTHWSQQQDALRVQAGWAVARDRPVVLHCRDSIPETLDLLAALPTRPRGVFHCFTGTLAEAERAIEMGFLLGIGGVVTFKNGGLDRVLPSVPLRYLVLETDSPYLAPVPHRGRRNESSYLPVVAARVAELTGHPPEAVEEQTTQNALDLFGP